MKEEKNTLNDTQSEKVSGGWMELNEKGKFKTKSLLSKNKKRYDRKCDMCGKKIPGKAFDVEGQDFCLDCWTKVFSTGALKGKKLKFKKDEHV